MNEREKPYVLTVPLDISKIKELEKPGAVKVAVQTAKGRITSQKVKVAPGRKAAAKIGFSKHPGQLNLAVGPADATDEELMRLETIRQVISIRQWSRRKRLQLTPVVISSHYWGWWLRWCRTFTVRGVVRCADGNPVPGATVCAYDVDWFWWWSTRQLTGCATTDLNGAFELSFRWCCRWLPWWWLRKRFWRLEPELIRRIQPIMQLQPDLVLHKDPPPQPVMTIFEEMLKGTRGSLRRIKPEFNPDVLPRLRKRLLEYLPRIPELERLKIWPWWPWYPWRDCRPDLIYRVTQNCEGEEQVIVDENIFDTRWDIPTASDVSLTANDNACCVGQPEIPEEDCLLLVSACDDLITEIGGNPPAAPGIFADTDGFRSPGGPGTWSDRPYAGVVPIHGEFGEGSDAAYYEFEWSDDDGNTWQDMPPDAAGNFVRRFYGPQLGEPVTAPSDWHRVRFAFDNMEDTAGNEHFVMMSRQHFETTHDPGTWGLGNDRQWAWMGISRLMRWKTEGHFLDKRYRLRVKSWTLDGDKLNTSRILPLCDTDDENGMVLTLDNRVVTDGPTNAHGQRCGRDTVHLCTTEPDTDIVTVTILHGDGTKTEVGPCGVEPVNEADMLQIDFVAYDPDGHLAMYELDLHWGEDERLDVLTLGTPTLPLNPITGVPESPVPWAPLADQVGPTYANAKADGATPPVWHGGAMRLTVQAADAFEKTCCYQLRLIARKRTIYSCDDDSWTHFNRSERSFMIERTS